MGVVSVWIVTWWVWFLCRGYPGGCGLCVDSYLDGCGRCVDSYLDGCGSYVEVAQKGVLDIYCVVCCNHGRVRGRVDISY